MRLHKIQLTEENKKDMKDKVGSVPSFLINKFFRLFSKSSSKEYLFELIVNNDKSYYRMIEDPQDNSIMKYVAERDGAVTTDLKTGITLQEDEFRDNQFLVIRDTKDLKWEITDESKKIGQYTCYKEVGVKRGINGKKIKEVEVTAWFTPDVPISAGPVIYSGLPGLVIYVQVGKASILLKDIEIGAKVKEIKEPTQGTKIKEAEYLEYKETEYRKDKPRKLF